MKESRFMNPVDRCAVFGLLLSLFASISHAGLYVSGGGDDSTHDSWSTAYPSLQEALDAAGDGDTIYVAGETFAITSPLEWAGGQNVTIRGGYAATNDTPLPGAHAPEQWPTVFTPASGVSTQVMNISYVTNGVLKNVTLTGGHTVDMASLPTVGMVSGLVVSECVDFSLLSCTVSDNRIEVTDGDAKWSLYGAGVHITGSDVAVSNCLVTGNVVDAARFCSVYGAGLYIDGSSTVTLLDSRIRHNRASISGDNRRTVQGGGLYSAGVTTLRNCLVDYNEAWHGNPAPGFESGDGLYCAAGSLVLENCTVVYNLDEGVRNAGGSLYVTNSILWANGDDVVGTVTLSHSCVEDGDEAGNNSNFSTDPLFEYGYFLGSGSDGIDAGTNAVFLLDGNYTTRADGVPDSGAVDLGYHYKDGYGTIVTNLYVSPDGDDGNSGLSWVEAKRSISAALAIATDGSAIHIAAGTYTKDTETFPLSIFDKRNVRLLGTDRSEVTIDAAGSGERVLLVRYAPETGLGNVTITGASIFDDGGGIRLESCHDVEIVSCNITNNFVTAADVKGNDAYGGGLFFLYGSATLRDCMIADNTARGGRWVYTSGAGVYLDKGASVTFLECVLARNFANINNNSASRQVYGGSIYSRGSALLRNCLVTENEARHNSGLTSYEGGSGIFAASGSLALENSTIVTNVEEGIEIGAAATAYATNSILWANGDDIVGTVTLGYCNIEDGDSGPGCISEDPLFVEASGGNYRLTRASPSVNTGYELSWTSGGTDLDGSPRRQGGIVDMGCYEVVPPGGTILLIR